VVLRHAKEHNRQVGEIPPPYGRGPASRKRAQPAGRGKNRHPLVAVLRHALYSDRQVGEKSATLWSWSCATHFTQTGIERFLTLAY
jgi:hypothetical protein